MNQAERASVDRLVRSMVNVPFPHVVGADELARALETGEVAPEVEGHLARLIGEAPIDLIYRFCDVHGIGMAVLAAFVERHRQALALYRPELEEDLRDLLPDT